MDLSCYKSQPELISLGFSISIGMCQVGAAHLILNLLLPVLIATATLETKTNKRSCMKTIFFTSYVSIAHSGD